MHRSPRIRLILHGLALCFASLLAVPAVQAQDHLDGIVPDTGLVRLVLLQSLDPIVGTVAEIDAEQVTIRTQAGTLKEFRRTMVLHAHELYHFVDASPPAPAVDSTDRVLELRGGVLLVGRIMTMNDSVIIMRRNDGRHLSIPIAATLSPRLFRDGDGSPAAVAPPAPDQHSSALFFSPTARPQQRFTISWIEGVIGAASVGIGDVLSLSVLGTFGGGMGFAKITILNTPFITVAACGSANLNGDGVGPGGIVTIGDDDNALTVGQFYSDGNLSWTIIGGEIRIGPRVKLMMENFITSSGYRTDNAFHIFGVRGGLGKSILWEFGMLIMNHVGSSNSGRHEDYFPLPFGALHFLF